MRKVIAFQNRVSDSTFQIKGFSTKFAKLYSNRNVEQTDEGIVAQDIKHRKGGENLQQNAVELALNSEFE